METGPLPDSTKPSLRPPSNWMWLFSQSCAGAPVSWQVVGMRKACWMSPLAYGLVASGKPSRPGRNPSAPRRRSMPSLLS
jgi:hypothetical protein